MKGWNRRGEFTDFLVGGRTTTRGRPCTCYATVSTASAATASSYMLLVRPSPPLSFRTCLTHGFTCSAFCREQLSVCSVRGL